MTQSAEKILDHELLFREPEYQELLSKKKEFEYNHSDDTVKSIVEWTNKDSFMSHTVKPDKPTPGMDSDTLFAGGMVPGNVFDWMVPADAKSGTKFFYHCKFHGIAGDGTRLGAGMVGVIVVK